MHYIIEGLDRLGKDTLIDGILNAKGFHQVIHFSKPARLGYYKPEGLELTDPELKAYQLEQYQRNSFLTMFSMLRSAQFASLVLNRAHLGEHVYAPMYRGYQGDYVFSLEKTFMMDQCPHIKLILLTEDFSVSKHFIDDGESFDITKREQEQNRFIEAFNRSVIANKKIVCVTDAGTGGFRSKLDVLRDALE